MAFTIVLIAQHSAFAIDLTAKQPAIVIYIVRRAVISCIRSDTNLLKLLWNHLSIN
ncbi:hypothetical protein NB723_000234 [Xanthomonas sacchari]|nr:hypothetical protein [Xanthomonas sacchari]